MSSNKFTEDFVSKLKEEIQQRWGREEKILSGTSVKTYEDYRYTLGRLHSLKEVLTTIEEIKKR